MEDTAVGQPGPNTVSCDKNYDCGQQGIQRGWVDSYGWSLDCSWIDITSVAPGTYVLNLAINPDRIFQEVSSDNNHAHITVIIPDLGELGAVDHEPVKVVTSLFDLPVKANLDAKCDDGIFCNGVSMTTTDGSCTPTVDPCYDGDVDTADTATRTPSRAPTRQVSPLRKRAASTASPTARARCAARTAAAASADTAPSRPAAARPSACQACARAAARALSSSTPPPST
eukprot:9472314-Pyramimonas_sp.AAC.2